MVQRLFADVINDAIWFMNIHEPNHPWFLAMHGSWIDNSGRPWENHRPVACHWQTLSYNVVHFALIEIQTHNISGDRHIGFEEGSITIKGYHSDIRGFTSNMSTEDGGIMISFCCRNDNHSNLHTLPQTHPFVLIKVN
jgi:hypothetical protein